MIQCISQLKDRALWCMRLSLFVILAWMGSLKFATYEAKALAPWLAHAPFLELNIQTNKNALESLSHPTNKIAHVIGILELLLALLLLLGLWFPLAGMGGGLLVALLAVATLCLLVIAPGIWIPDRGFPHLSTEGQSLLKNLLLFSGGLLVASTDAQRWLERKGFSSTPTQNTCGKKGCCG